MSVIDAIRTDQYAGQGGTYYYNDISGIRTPSASQVFLNPSPVKRITDSQPGSVKQILKWDRMPMFCSIGDSTNARGNLFFDPTSITASGTVATVTLTGHGLMVGNTICVQETVQPEFNGVFKVATRPDANTFTYNLLSTASVGTATGDIKIVSQSHIYETSFASVSNALSRNKGIYLGNYAFGGAITANLSSQLDLAFNPLNNAYLAKPDIVFISCGINDSANGFAASVAINNLQAAITRIVLNDAIPVVLTVMPHDNTHSSFTEARAVEAMAINAWLRENVDGLGGVLVDAHSVCVDPANQYGNWLSALTLDGLHPNKAAALQVAKLIKTKFWDSVISTDDRSVTLLSTNSTMSGTAGTLSGASASGSVADSYTVVATGNASQTTVCSKGVSRLAGFAQRINFTAVSLDDTAFISQTNSFHASLTTGDKFICRVTVTTESALSNLKNLSLQVRAQINGVLSTTYALCFGYSVSSVAAVGEKYGAILETPVIEVQASTTQLKSALYVVAKAAGNIVVDISKMEVLKLN